jgi:hypothetical protein
LQQLLRPSFYSVGAEERSPCVGGHDSYLREELLDTLKLEDGSEFRNFTPMPPTDFECLLQMIGGEISRQHEIQTIRLAAILRLLASGDYFTSWTYTGRISKQSLPRRKLGFEVWSLLSNSSTVTVHFTASEAMTSLI